MLKRKSTVSLSEQIKRMFILQNLYNKNHMATVHMHFTSPDMMLFVDLEVSVGLRPPLVGKCHQ